MMSLTRKDVIEMLKAVRDQVNATIADLEAAPSPDQTPSEDVCPIHHRKWLKTQYGLGHPLDDGSGKWCNKVKRKTQAGVGK